MKKNKTKLTQTLVSAFIIIIMVSSIAGFVITQSVSSSQNSVRYNDYKFKLTEEGYSLKFEGKELIFSYPPNYVENIELNKEDIEFLKDTKMIYGTLDPDDSLIQYIALTQYYLKPTLEELYMIYLQETFTKENEFNATIKTCRDSTPIIPVIYFKESDNTQITKQGNCLILESNSGEGFLMLKDRILYGMIGVING